MNKRKKTETKKKTTMENVIDWVVTIVMGLALYFAIDFCIGRVRVEGISMDTTFLEGQLLMVNKLNYRFNEPTRGDVVVFKSPVEPEKEYIKRLIGLPGDLDQRIPRIVAFPNRAALLRAAAIRRAFQRLDRRFVVARLIIIDAQPAVNVGVIRVDLNCFFNIQSRCVELALEK